MQLPAVYANDRSAMSHLFSSAASVTSNQQSLPGGSVNGSVHRGSVAGSAAARKPAPRRASADNQSVVTTNTRDRDAPPPNMNTRHQGKVIYMDKHQLLQFAATRVQHSLREIGGRKRKQMMSRSAMPSDLREVTSLTTSTILSLEEVEDLFFSLPFFTKPPTLRLIYSTAQHYRSLEELLTKTYKVCCDFE